MDSFEEFLKNQKDFYPTQAQAEWARAYDSTYGELHYSPGNRSGKTVLLEKLEEFWKQRISTST